MTYTKTKIEHFWQQICLLRHSNNELEIFVYSVINIVFNMDKKLLVTEIQKVIATFKPENKIFDFVCLEPIHGSETSFILNVKANWSNPSSSYEAIDLIVHRLYDVLDKETLKYINRVYIVNTEPRKNWEEAFAEMHRNGDDKLLINSVFEDEN